MSTGIKPALIIHKKKGNNSSLTSGLMNVISFSEDVNKLIFYYFFKKNFFFNIYLLLRDRERQTMSRGGAEREGDTESEAGSRL